MPGAMNDPEKQARLAQALRDNLRRRKAQARAGEGTPAPVEERAGGSQEDRDR